MNNVSNGLESGMIFVPYIFKPIKTTVNNETVWHANKWKNLFLKVTHLFYKSKNYKTFIKYSKKIVDSSLYEKIAVR